MDDVATTSALLCPHCGEPMRLARSVPHLGGLPELRTYDCKACGVCFTMAVEAGGRAPSSSTPTSS